MPTKEFDWESPLTVTYELTQHILTCRRNTGLITSKQWAEWPIDDMMRIPHRLLIQPDGSYHVHDLETGVVYSIPRCSWRAAAIKEWLEEDESAFKKVRPRPIETEQRRRLTPLTAAP